MDNGWIELTNEGEIKLWFPTIISNAIIYNKWRFLGYEDYNYFSLYKNDTEVYAYNNGWKKLNKDVDYTFHILDRHGDEITDVREKGYYTLVVRGKGNCRGEASQSLHIGEFDDWSDHQATSFSQKDDQNHVITITSEAELALLAAVFQRTYVPYEGWTFLLGCDLDLGNYTWTPIGSNVSGDDTDFSGHFDGQGHTIKGIHFERGNSSGNNSNLFPQGLFGNVHSGSIKNLTISDSEIVSAYNMGVGGIAGVVSYDATVENCHVTSSVNVICLQGHANNTYSGDSYGGVAGYCGGIMKGCTSAAHVFKKSGAGGCQAFGGIVGHFYSSRPLTNCIYYGDQVYADGETGAIIGRLGEISQGKISHCYYTSTTLMGVNGDDQSETIKVKAFKMGNVESVDYGGNMTTEYGYNGIKVYPNAMVYNGVIYTQPQYVTLNNEGGSTEPEPEITLAGLGTEGSPYLISNAEEWQLFAKNIGDGLTYSGKFVKLTKDIRTSVMVGNENSNDHAFKGTFDGDGHTIFFDRETESTEHDIAPFRSINGATIKNLHTTGVITIGTDHAAGIVSRVFGNSTISSCRSDITIKATGGEYYSGIACMVASNAQLTITDVLFDGCLVGPSATFCSGFVAYVGGSLTLNNCLYAPGLQTVGDTGGNVGNGTFFRFVGDNHTVNNCYYTQPLGVAQGTRVDESDLRSSTFLDRIGEGWMEYNDENIIDIALPIGAHHLTCVNGYVLFNNTTGTLIFLCDGKEATHTAENEKVFPLPFRRQFPTWIFDQDAKNASHFVFDPSFSSARPVNCYFWFLTNWVQDIDGLEYLNTSLVNNMESMFFGCKGIQSLDVSRFDTSNVTNMKQMFSGCGELTTLDLSSFDTGNVTNMSDMFNGCSKLTTLDLSTFDTGNVTNMSYMFSYCNELTTLDLSSFNTGNVTNMADMFSGCTKLTKPILSSFDTRNVTNMYSMFQYCNELTTLDLSSFDTGNVTNMDFLFQHCINLKTLNISSFNTEKVNTMRYMFEYCKNLTALDLSNFNTSAVEEMESMFYDCTNLETLNLSSFNTKKVKDMSYMFHGCTNLTTLDLSSFNTSAVTDMESMFQNCTNLTTLDLSSFNTSAVDGMSGMFYGCKNLKTLDLSSFNTSQVTDMFLMFCESGIVTLDISSFNTSKVKDMEQMFINCSQLTTIYVGNDWNMNAVEDMDRMFENCTNLVGGNGTAYSSDHTGGDYAHIDEGTDHPGYFSEALPTVVLQDDADNTAVVANNTAPCKAILQGRTLRKDGSWNTLCLPFDLTIASSVLHDADVRTLSSVSKASNTLTLNYTDEGEVTTIKAGVPYIVKWTDGDDLKNPVFLGVVMNPGNNPIDFPDIITFHGVTSPYTLDAGDKTKLFFGEDDTLNSPVNETTINACRAYFQLSEPLADQLLSTQGIDKILLNVGVSTYIIDVPSMVDNADGDWYTLDGRKLSGKPTQKGVYMVNGQKVMIK